MCNECPVRCKLLKVSSMHVANKEGKNHKKTELQMNELIRQSIRGAGVGMNMKTQGKNGHEVTMANARDAKKRGNMDK